MNFKVETFETVPDQQRVRSGKCNELVTAVQGLTKGQKLVIELDANVDFRKQVDSISSSIRRKGLLTFRPITRSSRKDNTLTIYNNDTN